MLRTLLGVGRLLACVVYIVAGILRGALIFPFIGPERRMAQVGRWCARMAALLGLQVQGSGVPQPGPVLVVANHISWLDILAINAVQPARFVSKADVRRWPVLGWLVACGGTLFIERERKRDALRVVHQIAEALKQGSTVAMFPEGTTGEGDALLPFHANLLQAAVSTGTPLQPLALRYADAEATPSRAVVWVGDTTLVGSLWQVVRARRLRVQVSLLPVVGTVGQERRELSDRVRGQIAAALGFEEGGAPAAH